MTSRIQRGLALKTVVYTALLALGFASSASAEIVLGGRDANGNFNNSGQNINPAPNGVGQFVGKFGNGSAVTIAPQYLLTAFHVAATPTFTFNNGGPTATTYHVSLVATSGELAVYQITDPGMAFSVYAPIYTKSDEVGKDLFSVGYGVGRGAEVNTPGTSDLAGWNWSGVQSGNQNWGANSVDAIATDGANEFLAFGFDRKTDAMGVVLNPDEGILSDHDSGGGTFINDGGVWKLAGINDTIDAVFAPGSTAANPKFVDAVFNTTGFFSDPNATVPFVGPENSYSVRLSTDANQAFLAPFIPRAVPEPGSFALLAGGMTIAALRWRKRMRSARLG